MFGCKRKGGRERERGRTRKNTHQRKQTQTKREKANTQGMARETHEPELALWSCSVARSSKLVAASHSLLKSC